MATLDNVLQERNGLRPETARCQAVIGGNVTVLREASSLSRLQAEWSEISRKFQKSLAGFCTHTHTQFLYPRLKFLLANDSHSRR